MNLLRPSLKGKGTAHSSQTESQWLSSRNPFSESRELADQPLSQKFEALERCKIECQSQHMASAEVEREPNVQFGEPSTGPFTVQVEHAPARGPFDATREGSTTPSLEQSRAGGLQYFISGVTEAPEFSGIELRKKVSFAEVLLLHHFLTVRFAKHPIRAAVIPPPPIVALDSDRLTLMSVSNFLQRVFSHPVLRSDPGAILFWKTRHFYSPQGASLQSAHRFYHLQLELAERRHLNVAPYVGEGKPELFKTRPTVLAARVATMLESLPSVAQPSSPTPCSTHPAQTPEFEASKYYSSVDVDQQMQDFGKFVEQLHCQLKALEKTAIRTSQTFQHINSANARVEGALLKVGAVLEQRQSEKEPLASVPLKSLFHLLSKCYTVSELSTASLLATDYQFTIPLLSQSLMWSSVSAANLLERRLTALANYDHACKQTQKNLNDLKRIKNRKSISSTEVENVISELDEVSLLFCPC